MEIASEAIIARLSQAGVKSAAVVDDAFDAPSPAALAERVDVFWETVQADPHAKDELEKLGIVCEDREAFERDGLQQTWEKRNEFNDALTPIVRELFVDLEELLRDPEAVVRHLERLHLSPVHRVGSNDEIPRGIPLVFLDYDLESLNRGAGGFGVSRRSEVIATELSKRQDAPFLVLFSNRPDAKGAADAFRENTGYLRGTFAFLSKERASTEKELYALLFGSCVGHPALNITQQFFFTLKRQLETVANNVKRGVMQLDVQDYAFIQRLGLQEDGALLGEYMLDLFAAALSHELRNEPEVQKMRRALDGVDFGQRHLPFADHPSLPVQMLYRAMLTEAGVGSAEPHPLAVGLKCKDHNGAPCNFPPLLMLGDIFIHGSSKSVYVVMNPACDLQYSPKNMKRQPSTKLSVYLMPGQLELVSNPISFTTGHRMEWIEYQNQFWRVYWHVDEVITVKLGEFDGWQQQNGYQRIARLNLSHSLVLQQQWTGSLNRIGLPVNLPFFDGCSMRLYRLGDNNEWQECGAEIAREVIVARHPRDTKELTHFTLTQKGREQLYDQINELLPELGISPTRARAATNLLVNWKFWTDLAEVPRKMTQKSGAVDLSTPSVLFSWKTPPKVSELEKQMNQQFEAIVLLVVLEIP